jgi:4-aminobutyrate aminotransferase
MSTVTRKAEQPPLASKIPGPRAAALIARDKKRVSPSYPRGVPLVMERGRGSEIWDVDGNRFLDFAAGIAVCSTGHAHPKVVAAIQEQAAKFLHISPDFYHETMIRLAEKLADIAPVEDPVVFLGNSGTEMVEGGLKLARYHTGRTQFIGFFGAFHGRSFGSVSFTASKPKYRHGFFPLLPGVTHIPFPDPRRPILDTAGGDAGEAVIRYMEDVLFKGPLPAEDVAGILVEPIQGEGGYIVPPASFFPALRELCDRHGIVMIADEVQSGMGRTGKWWAVDHWGVKPDIVLSAKGIASGLPLGAMIASRRVATWTKGTHGNTYGGNPIASAAANATIDVIEQEGLLANTREIGARITAGMRRMMDAHECIGDVRGPGLMIGVEFVKDRATREPDMAMAERVVEEAFHRGLILLECGRSVIRIAPPLNLTAAHADEGLALFESALKAAEGRA